MKHASKQTPNGEVELVKGTDGRIYIHAVEGAIFRKIVSDNITHYQEVKVLPGAVLTELPGYMSLLVRHGKPGVGCVYYPLPLVLADKEQRQHMAQVQNRRPMPERWVKRIRYSLGRLLAPTSRDVNEHAVSDQAVVRM